MTSSERPSPEPILKKRGAPSRTGGETILEMLWKPSNALNYRAWGIPAVLSRGIPGKTLRAFPVSFLGLFRGAVIRHGGGALKQPIKQPTETPTSTLALMGRFPSLMGQFPTLMGRFADFVLRGRFTS